MNRVGMNIVLGTFWIFVAIWMFMTGEGTETQMSSAVLIVLGMLFYWSAYKLYVNPNLAKKNKRNLIQKMTDPESKKKTKKK